MNDRKPEAVLVRIGGKDYSIRSDGDPEYTRKCAEYVNKRMYAIKREVGPLEPERLAMLAALSIADTLFQVEQEEENVCMEVTASIEKMVGTLERAISEE